MGVVVDVIVRRYVVPFLEGKLLATALDAAANLFGTDSTTTHAPLYLQDADGLHDFTSAFSNIRANCPIV
jgi:hypothetical protein